MPAVLTRRTPPLPLFLPAAVIRDTILRLPPSADDGNRGGFFSPSSFPVGNEAFLSPPTPPVSGFPTTFAALFTRVRFLVHLLPLPGEGAVARPSRFVGAMRDGAAV